MTHSELSMHGIPFSKMSGSGNDFIIIDDRKGVFDGKNLSAFAQKICERRVSVGADGCILIQEAEKADFKWRFFNADGSEAEMCGNGGRCAARFAFLKGFAGKEISFETLSGVIKAEIIEDRVKLAMGLPKNISLGETLLIKEEKHVVHFINTGVPHVVKFVNDVEDCEVVQLGSQIRCHDHYQPAGTNADFVTVQDRSHMKVRTYERGVEDETLACGTGAVASALIANLKGLITSPAAVTTQGGGVLTVHFQYQNSGFTEVFLEGDARIIYEGQLGEDAIWHP